MMRLFGIALVLVHEPIGLFCYIVLSVMNNQANTTIECSSNSDVLFTFVSDKTNTTITISECETTLKSCYLVEKSHSVNYDTFYNGKGGILHVLNVCEDTYGTYSCYETYNPGNYVRTVLKPQVIPRIKSVSAEPFSPTHCQDYAIGPAVIGINTAVLVFSLLHLILLCMEKHKRLSRLLRQRVTCFSNKKSVADCIQMDEMDIEEMMYPLMDNPRKVAFEDTIPVYRVPEVRNAVCDLYCTRHMFPIERRYPRYLLRQGLDIDLLQRHRLIPEHLLD